MAPVPFADMTALSGTAALCSIALTAVGLFNLNWLPIPARSS